MNMRRWGWSLLLTGLACVASAQNDTANAFINLVSNINTVGVSSLPQEFTATENGLYFLADDSAGFALWRTIGTADDTEKCAGPGLGVPRFGSLVSCGPRLYFRAANATGVTTGLWTTTSADCDLVPNVMDVGVMGAWGSTLLFGVPGSNAVFRAINTSTSLLHPLAPGAAPRAFKEVNDSQFVVVTSTGVDNSIHVATAGAITELDSGLTDLAADNMVITENPDTGDADLFVAATDGGSPRVLQIDLSGEGVATRYTGSILPGSLCAIGTRVFFADDTGENIYYIDGEPAQRVSIVDSGFGTTRLTDITQLTPVTDDLFFSARTSRFGEELWMCSVGGGGVDPARCIDINTNLTVHPITGQTNGFSSTPETLFDFAGQLAFAANDGDGDGRMLWLYRNGSLNKIRGEDEAEGLSGHAEFSTFGSDLFFSAEGEGGIGVEPWRLVGNGRFVPLGWLQECPTSDTDWFPVVTWSNTNYPAPAVRVRKPDDTYHVLFVDPLGECKVEWVGDSGGSNRWDYRVREDEEYPELTKRIYHTEDASRAPVIDLGAVPYDVELCANRGVVAAWIETRETTIEIDLGNDVTTNQIGIIEIPHNGNVWVDGNNSLHADTIENELGGNDARFKKFVLYYVDGNDRYQDHEIVQILPYATTNINHEWVGARLHHPPTDGFEDNGIPTVTAGQMMSRDDAGYIYQHRDQGGLNGTVYAVRESPFDELKMEVFWMRDGLYEVAWPYSMDRYRTDWPDAAAQRLIRRADAIEPRVAIPTDLNPYKMPEEDFGADEFAHGYLEGGEFYTDGAGFSLLLLESGPPQRRDWLDFIVVKSVMNTNVDVFAYNGTAFGAGGNDNTYTNRTTVPWPIGEVITNAYHTGDVAGYIYHTAAEVDDDLFHPEFYGDANAQGMHEGSIFSVNEGVLEAWWCNLSHTTNTHDHGAANASIQWPSYVMVYSNMWPEVFAAAYPERTTAEWPDLNPDVVIAAQTGTGPIDIPEDDWSLYYQNDSFQHGFNPNDEHAFVRPVEAGDALGVFPLRCDFFRAGQQDCSKPYVIVEDRSGTDPVTGDVVNDLHVWKVVDTDATHTFIARTNVVGSLVRVPFPLERGNLVISEKTYLPHPESSALWRDRKEWFWARATGLDTSLKERIIKYYYNVLDGFYFPPWYRAVMTDPDVTGSDGILGVGDEIPWLDALSGGMTAGSVGNPVDFNYLIQLPDDIPELYLGQTLTKTVNGLPAVWDQLSVEIIYQQGCYKGSVQDLNQISVDLIDPINEQSEPLKTSEGDPMALTSAQKDLMLQIVEGKSVFKDLPAHLQARLTYDELQGEGYLRFSGRMLEPSVGNHYLLLNVMSASDAAIIRETFGPDPGIDVFGSSDEDNQRFEVAVEALIAKASAIQYVQTNVPFANLALSTGPARATGLVTLAFNNSTNTTINAPGDPITLGVLRVVGELYRGQIFPVNSKNPFDENLVMRHTLDFGGEGEYLYEWQYTATNKEPDVVSTGVLGSAWFEAKELYRNGGAGEVEIMVGGKPEFVLKDNFFTCRYKPTDPNHPLYVADRDKGWSKWVDPPKIAMSWVKRVMDGINPFEQRVQQFDTYAPNTTMTMLQQVGPAYAGAVPLNLDHVDDYGLVEIYETVFRRALALSYDGASWHDEGIDNTLLLAAGRLADLYMVLGNEAYADACDPTIGFGTEHGDYGAEASSMFCFMNMVPSLLAEELSLLRGRDDTAAPGTDISPHFNRLPWNMSWDMLGGEVAYSLNYEITDVNNSDGEREADGIIDAYDAAMLYPQGHGDAWGHYLTAVSYYYRLIHESEFHWEPRVETLLLNGQNVEVDFLDERKFAKAASARARTGSEVVGLVYREQYSDDPADRLRGYPDSDTNRCWGVSDWASRAGQAAYFDWVIGNAMLPTNSTATGLSKVDRSTVLELPEILEHGREIQRQADSADIGLNPLGLAANVVPFDISPASIDQGQTHFEQIYARALTALGNAGTVFDHAQNASQQLRRQFDSHEEFVEAVEEQEFDYENRLIELYGYPYQDDIGPGKTYPQGYEGPDYYHYNYVDLNELLGVIQDIKGTNLDVVAKQVQSDGTVVETVKSITVHYTGGVPFWEVKPNDWTQPRRAPGEIQLARGELLQAVGRYLSAEVEYANLVEQIEDEADLFMLRNSVADQALALLNSTKLKQVSFNTTISRLRSHLGTLNKLAEFLPKVGQALSSAIPTVSGIVVGFSNGFTIDPWGTFRTALESVANMNGDLMKAAGNLLSGVELGIAQNKEIVSIDTDIQIRDIKDKLEEAGAFKKLEQLIRGEASASLNLENEMETITQSAGRYYKLVQQARRIEAERLRFRKQTAAQLQDYLYKDMAFRIFRNDALQRYRAQFDLAARYAYLAARAYGYETCMVDDSWNDFSQSSILKQIVRARTIGYMENGVPVWGSDYGGLAEALGEMDLNWFVVGPQFGFNNPQTETGRFSLRSELFRILPGMDGDTTWREQLQACIVDDIRDVPEFSKYCIPFDPMQASEPAIVISFPTTVNFGHNFFGWLAGGGDNAYDSANFATKIRSAGIWFSNYNNVEGGGLLNTPRVYLVPVGTDIMRTPLGDRGDIVTFEVLDQALPLPLTVGSSELSDPAYIPMHDTGIDDLCQIRRHGRIRAYHDGGSFDEAETLTNGRLVGRSVWNTRWMLIIPAGTLHSDREEGLSRFIHGALQPDGSRDGNGVKDIRVFFQTYAYEGI